MAKLQDAPLYPNLKDLPKKTEKQEPEVVTEGGGGGGEGTLYAPSAPPGDEMIDNESYLMEPGAGGSSVDVGGDEKEAEYIEDMVGGPTTGGGDEGEKENSLIRGMMTDEGFQIDVTEAYLEPEGGQIALPSNVVAKPTLMGLPPDQFHPEAICSRIHKTANKWFQKKVNIVQALVDELCVLNEPQRMQVVRTYALLHKNYNLSRLIRVNTQDALRDIMVALTIPRAEYDAHWLHLALTKKSINLLLNILCTISTEDVKNAHVAYDTLYPKAPLLKSVLSLTSGWFHKRTIQGFFTNVLEKGRASVTIPVDRELIVKDAELLLKASQNKLDKQPFVEIFSLRSFEHLAGVAVEFQRISDGKNLLYVIKESFKEQSETGYACDITLYYATRRGELLADFLKKALFKPGKRYEMLTRIVVRRAEIDMANVLQVYGRDEFRKWTAKEFQNRNRFYSKIICTLCAIQDETAEKKK